MYSFRIFSALFLILLLVSCQTELPDYRDAPETAYNYYSGAKKYGNHFCKVQEFTHKENGKNVSLIGMIHIADPAFYKQVDEELDKADLILEEGIHGLPSFGISKYFSQYSFSVINRFGILQGLASQSHSLEDRENTKSADMDVNQFKAQSNFLTPLIQLVSLPVMIIVTEPYYFYNWSKNELLSNIDERHLKSSESGLRHSMLMNMEFSDKPAKVLLPGIIEARNAHLIKVLQESLEDEKVNSIAIPWGAAHMPSLENDMINIGFRKTGEPKWLRSIAVSDYKNTVEEKFERAVTYTGIPYIFNIETQNNYTLTSALFSTIKSVKATDYDRFSLLWGDLFDNISFENSGYISLLPKIAGKPLLFDYTNQKGKKRLRFLWFFEFGNLKRK